MLPVALKRPTKTWQEFTFVFQSVDNTTVATLKVKKPQENVVLVLRRWDYDSSRSNGIKDQQVIQLSQEVSQQFSLQDWTFISLSVDSGRLWLALKGVSFARFDEVIAKGFHQVYAFVTNGHCIDVSFYCDEGGVVGEATPQELDKAALAVVIVLAVMLLLLIPLAVVCYCAKRRRRKRSNKSAREKPVHVERKVVKDAVPLAYVEMPEIKPLMSGDLIGTPEEAEKGHDHQNVSEENVPREICEEITESVDNDDHSLSADVEEANTQGSEVPMPHLEEEQNEDVREDESDEPEEINAKDQNAAEENTCESGLEKNDGESDGKDVEAVGESGPEVEVHDVDEQVEFHDVDEQVEVHDVDEHMKTQGEKFLQGLLRTRERAIASLAGSPEGEAGNPTEVSDDSSGDICVEDNKEPAGKSVEELIDMQEKKLADLINEMLYYSRRVGATDEHGRTGDDGHETRQHHDSSREIEPDEVAEGATGDASEEVPNGESSEAPEETGVEEDQEAFEGKDESAANTDISPIVFPVGNSDYGVEKYKEAGIEAVYSETPEEENRSKARLKKVYRPTPLTSLKFP